MSNKKKKGTTVTLLRTFSQRLTNAVSLNIQPLSLSPAWDALAWMRGQRSATRLDLIVMQRRAEA